MPFWEIGCRKVPKKAKNLDSRLSAVQIKQPADINHVPPEEIKSNRTYPVQNLQTPFIYFTVSYIDSLSFRR